MSEPRFLSVSDRLYLIFVDVDTAGVISAVRGPVQCIGDAGVNAPDFISALSKLCADALYNKPILLFADLPKSVQSSITIAPTNTESVQES